jgi:hypothetical protein
LQFTRQYLNIYGNQVRSRTELSGLPMDETARAVEKAIEG